MLQLQNTKWLVLWWFLLNLFGHAGAAEVYPTSDATYTQSLNGNWSFKYLPGLDAGADAQFTAPAFDVARWSTIPVPSNWELQGHAEPSYGDNLKDGLGLYRRTFSLPKNWQGRRTYLRFDGVAFGYEVWVNGKLAGKSSASAFNRHTFDVTDLLQAKNTVAVRVTTKPLGYEFDLNDDWSLSGIYRDVTLISLPATQVQDIATRTNLKGNAAQLMLDVQLSSANAAVQAQLFDPRGKRVANQVLKSTAAGNQLRASLQLTQPQLWTAETPSLYRLVLTVTQHGKTIQTVEQRIGLREIKVDGKLLLVNGKPIKLRGVNHHDLDPVTGRAVTEAQIRQDLALLKQANVNYVRTSHYPPHPRLLDLCDELGFYVMDEVAIGHGEKNLDNPAYRDNILARARATVARDKHHASIIIWSIGNENPINDFELEAGQLVKQLDPTRPITIPKIGSYFAKNYERLPPHVDLYAPHYPSNATLSGYADKLTRPTILTEYAHALGLATDRLQDQWAILQANPVFAGGSVWHFHDQGLLRRSATPIDPVQPTQYAWRDAHHYYDTHGLDGADGLVYADRTPQVDYWQMRKVYAPVQFIERDAQVGTGAQQVTVTLENRHDFRSLQGITLHWTLQQNGKVVQQGQQPLSAPARGRQAATIAVDIPAPRPYTDVLTLQLRAVDEHGLQINERALRLLRAEPRNFDWTAGAAANGPAPVLEDNADAIAVTTPQWRLTVQRASGALQIRDGSGRVLVDGIHPHSGRRLTMAEALGAQKSGTWPASILERLEQPKITAEQLEGRVRLSVHGTYRLPPPVVTDVPRTAATALPDDLVPTGASAAAATPDQGLTGGYELEIDGRGALTVNYTYRPLTTGAIVAEAGLTVVAPTGAEELRWIGQGPYAGYPGKDQLNEFGLYHLNRDDLRFQGNRRQTELAVLTAAGGAGFALAMPAADVAADVAAERHGARTLLSHNALIGGLGNKGTQPETIVALDAGAKISGRFVLLPLDGAWSQPLQAWFGPPGAAVKIFKPFVHSYDQ
jgi:beta-galactosidase